MSWVTTLLQQALKAQEDSEKIMNDLAIDLVLHKAQTHILSMLNPLEVSSGKIAAFLAGQRNNQKREFCFFNYMNSIWSEMSPPVFAYYDTLGCYADMLEYQYEAQAPEIMRLRAWLKDVQELDLAEIVDLDDLRHALIELEEKHARVLEPS